MEKAKLVLENVSKPKIHKSACCPLAVFRQCNCMVSFECRIHGDKCVGSHD